MGKGNDTDADHDGPADSPSHKSKNSPPNNTTEGGARMPDDNVTDDEASRDSDQPDSDHEDSSNHSDDSCFLKSDEKVWIAPFG